MNGPIIEFEADDATAAAVLHDEVDRKEFNEEFGFVAQCLAIKRVQHRVPGTVGRGAGAVCWRTLAEIGRHAAEWALVDAAVLRARERHPPMLEFVDSSRRIPAQILNRILVAQPV